MRRTSLLPLLLLVLVPAFAGCDRPVVPSPPTLEPLLVHAEWDWLRDRERRVVLLRGASYSSLERGRKALRRRAPSEEDFRWLASLGFNLIRLPLAWSALEPQPNQFNPAFLRKHVDPLLRFASNQGMQVVLSLHQARWSACVPGGHGAPAWACPPRGHEPGNEPSPVPRAVRARCDFFAGAVAPDGRPLRDHYVDVWRMIAAYYEQDRRILGFDLLDEPTPDACFADGSFVEELLDPLYLEIRTAIRRTGAPQALVYQPAIAPDDPLLGAPRGIGPDAVFAPHIFTQTFGAPAGIRREAALDALYARAERTARRLGGPLLVGEIGADGRPEGAYRPVTPGFLRESLDALDRHLVGGAVWAFVPQGHTPAHASGLGIGNEDDARILARPFARRIAGIPTAMRFDDASREFELAFRDDPDVSPPDPSEIFLPAKRRYPDGFRVEVTPGDRWTFDDHAQRLLVYRGAGDGERLHTVRIAPPAR